MKIPIKQLLFFTLFLGSALVGFAQEATTLSLKKAIEYALENNIATSKAKLDEQESLYNVKEVRSQALPQIIFTGSLDDNLNIPVQLLPGEIVGQPGTTVEARFGQQYTVTGGLELNQKIYDQTVIGALKAADAAKGYYALNTKRTKEDVIYLITSDYYQTLILQENLNILRENQTKIKKLIEVAEYQQKAGVLKTVDVNRLKVNLTNGETTIRNVESELENQLNTMKYHMGMDIYAPIKLDASSDLLDESKLAMALAINDVSPLRTDYQIVKQQQLLNEMEIKNFRAGYYPSLSAYARYSYNAQRNEFNFFESSKPWFNASVIGARLTIPVFDGFRKRSQIQQSKIRFEKLERDEKNIHLSIDLEYQNAQNQYMNSQKSLEAQKANVTLAEEVYKVTEDSYKQGIVNLSDLINSETELLAASNNYNEALLKFKLAQLHILKAKGQLLTILN